MLAACWQADAHAARRPRADARLRDASRPKTGEVALSHPKTGANRRFPRQSPVLGGGRRRACRARQASRLTLHIGRPRALLHRLRNAPPAAVCRV